MSLKGGAKMISEEILKNGYQFIGHLYDRVILGGAENIGEIEKAENEDSIIELHLFNKQKEIFYRRVDGVLKKYDDMLHEEDEDKFITRKYKISRESTGYKTLVVREYIGYDEITGMAYVENTVLYGLESGDDGKGEL